MHMSAEILDGLFWADPLARVDGQHSFHNVLNILVKNHS